MNTIDHDRDEHFADGGGDDLLAAEYVLGLLDDPAMRSARARVDTDAPFAREVTAWETRFAPWLAAIPPVPVPDRVWHRIRETLGHSDTGTAVGARAPVTMRPSLWDRISFWRGLAAGGFTVAAASLAALLITVRTAPVETARPVPQIVSTAPPPPAAAPMVVSLRHDDGTAAYSATVDPTTGVITLIPASMPDDVRVPELWLIPADGVPRSLGVVARDHAMLVTIPEAMRAEAAANTVFAVTLEPDGGSPTGKPTGPVVAKGNLIRL
ncbi:MAG: anti-sigma factor [Luteimonas sp.]